MAFNQVIDGNLLVAGASTNSGTEAWTGTIAAGSVSSTATTTNATAIANSITVNSQRARITTETLSTAAASTYTLTVTNSTISAADFVFCAVGNGTNTALNPIVSSVTPTAGVLTVVLRTTSALNGTLVFAMWAMH